MTCSEAETKNKANLVQADLMSCLCALACMVAFIMLGTGSKAPNGSTSGAGYIMFFCACCCCCSMMSAGSDLMRVSAC